MPGLLGHGTGYANRRLLLTTRGCAPHHFDLCPAGKDMPGSDSLTQEEQVSSLTMGGFDDCLFSVDLPLLNIPRCAPGMQHAPVQPAGWHRVTAHVEARQQVLIAGSTWSLRVLCGRRTRVKQHKLPFARPTAMHDRLLLCWTCCLYFQRPLNNSAAVPGPAAGMGWAALRARPCRRSSRAWTRGLATSCWTRQGPTTGWRTSCLAGENTSPSLLHLTWPPPACCAERCG